MIQRLINMHLCYNNWPITNGLRTLFFTLVLMLIPIGAWGTITGSGTEEDPYIPTSGDEMRSAVNSINSSDSKTGFIRLGNDIDLGQDKTLEITTGNTITIDLNGHDLHQNKYNDYSHCVIKNDGNLTIKDNTGNNGVIYGGYNTSINRKGGGIYNTSTGTLTFESGCIGSTSKPNTATYGGGIYNEGALIIKGGVIQNNSNSAIYHDGTSFKMEGNLDITSSLGGVINLKSGKIIEITGNLSTVTPIGITMESLGIFTSGLYGRGSLSNFTSDDPLIGVYADGTEAKLKTYWNWLQDELTAGHSVNLDKDYTRHTTFDNKGLVVPEGATLTIDLQGHTIDCKRQGNQVSSGYVIKNLGTLTIQDTGTGGIITGGNNNSYDDDRGGGICNRGTLTISGGSIQNNSSSIAGGIYNIGTLTISGGAIKNNSSVGQGGGVWNVGGSLTISGGTIDSNTSNSSGGGISTQGGTVTVSGGLIQNNAANGGRGGGICQESNGTVIVSGGTIQNNSSREEGGGIFNSTSGEINISGGSINNNFSSYSNGGGICNQGVFKLSGAPIIKDNKKISTADSNVYLFSGHIEILEGGLSNTFPIGIEMQTRGVFTTGLSNYTGNYSNFTSDISSVGVFDSSGEAKLQSYWDNLKDLFSAGGDITLERNYEAYQNDNGMLHIPSDKTVNLNLNGHSIDRKLTTATVNGCVICNEGELKITGTGIIRGGNNNNTGEYKGNGIWHNGTRNTGLSMQDSPVTDIYLANAKTITITGLLTNTTAIGIASDDANNVFTTGLLNNGNANNFKALQDVKGIGVNSAGNAIIGNTYAVTPSNCTVYDVLGNSKTKAVGGEALTITLSSSALVPLSLVYSLPDADPVVISAYPKNGNYSFTMPSAGCPVHITATWYTGGYCGDGADIEVMKWYIQDNTLKFITDNGTNRAMKNYAQNEVPWRNSGAKGVNLDYVTSITDYAFYNSNSLNTTVTIPTTVTSIGDKAFWGCKNLPAINVNTPHGQYESEGGVLYNNGKTILICYPGGKSETSYNLPNSVTSINEGAFAHNTSLQEINVVSGGVPSFVAEDGVLFTNGKTTLVRYPAGKENVTAYTIPNTVTKIESYAFQDCKHINCALTHMYVMHDLKTGGSANMFENSDFFIKVPSADVYEYRNSANYWSDYYSRISGISLTGPSIALANSSLDYTGSPITQSSISVSIDGRTLDPANEYDVSYENNTEVGTATVNITGKGNYTGLTGSTTFNITRMLNFNVNTNYVTYFASENLQKPSMYESVIFNTEYSTWREYHIYIITKIEHNIIYLTEVSFFPKDTPVLLYHDVSKSFENRTFHLSKKTETETIPASCSEFKGFDVDKTYEELDPAPHTKQLYVLRNNKFVRVEETTGTLKARRCCILSPDRSAASPAPYLTFSEDEGATDMMAIGVGENQKLFTPDWYTLEGRKLDRMPTQKGIYINNGRKVIIK